MQRLRKPLLSGWIERGLAMRHKRRELIAVVGALGVVIALAGFVGGYMSVTTTIVWAFGVWILGTVLVQLFTDPPEGGR
jgi:hypothetical protein